MTAYVQPVDPDAPNPGQMPCALGGDSISAVEARSQGLQPAPRELFMKGAVGVCAECHSDLYSRKNAHFGREGRSFCLKCSLGKQPAAAPGSGDCVWCGRKIQQGSRSTLYCTNVCRSYARDAMSKMYMRRLRRDDPKREKRNKENSFLRRGLVMREIEKTCERPGCSNVFKVLTRQESSDQKYCSRKCGSSAWHLERKARGALKSAAPRRAKRRVTAACPKPVPPKPKVEFLDVPRCVPGRAWRLVFSPSLPHALAPKVAVAIHAQLSRLEASGHTGTASHALFFQKASGGGSWVVHSLSGFDFAAKRPMVDLGDQTYDLRFLPHEPYEIQPLRLGTYEVSMHSTSPLVISSNGHRDIHAPARVDSYLLAVANRLRLPAVPTPPVSDVRLDGEFVEFRLGGHYQRGGSAPGVIKGWSGRVSFVTDAWGAWLAMAARRVGFGGMTAQGLGRVTVIVSRKEVEQ